MPEDLFDLSEEYEAMLQQGVGLSGEDASFFLAGRVEALRKALGSFRPRRILDFGCGIGRSSRLLADVFGAEVVGIDTSRPALDRAEREFGSDTVRFQDAAQALPAGCFDLCYVNGVFHHIDPAQQAGALSGIYAALRADARFALFENNPWNPGARWVMSLIPFDRDAKMISPRECRALLRRAGFEIANTRSLFYFPRPLSLLRFTEPLLALLPLGAQYYVLGVKK